MHVPAGLTYGQTLIAVRSVLLELGVSQPTMGAVCFCGESVKVSGLMPYSPAEQRVPRQRAAEVMEVRRGA